MRQPKPDDARRRELLDEDRKLRWLRLQTDLLKAVLYQDHALGPAEARRLVYDFRRRVLEVFPGEEGTFDLLLLPRFERVIRERWGEDLDTTVH